jgi:nitrogen-specific signal transduction histidine kinase/CheY-like chemotaxis protein
VRDVTERKQLEADLRHAQKMEAIGTLAGGIAHDFNNILAAILGFGELARLQAEHDPALCDTIDQIMRAGGRARDLVQQILAFGRRTAEQRRPVELAPIVAETLRLLRSSIPATIALRQDLRDAGPVLADATGLHQVAMNLCTNAYQALAPTGGELAVTVREVDLAPRDAGPGSGPWVMLEVRDDGPGIGAEIQGKIFEPYFTTKGDGRGTGLGLSVVHGIVREHRGTIEVESAPGEGARFRVWLPRHVDRAAAADEPAAAADGTGTERVLLVDDEPDLVRIAELGLARHGYRVRGFTAPQAALAAFRADPGAWDVVVTDVTKPGMTGLALADALLALRPDLPVVLCTGNTEGLTTAAVRAAGIRAVVAKPVTAGGLAAEIRAAVDAGAPVSPGPS